MSALTKFREIVHACLNAEDPHCVAAGRKRWS